MGRCSTPEELQQFLDDRLDVAQTELIAAHLDDCKGCRNVLEQITTCAPRPAGHARSSAVEEDGWIDGVLARVKAKGPRPPRLSAEDRANRDRDVASSLADGPLLPLDRVENRSRSSAGPGPALPGFRIIREIGRGGMGVVYEAVEENLNRRVAVKILQAHSLEDPRWVRRFEREAKAAGRLHHTNIVPVFGVGEFEGTHFCVMQYIDGLGLDLVIDELRRLRRAGWNPHHANELALAERTRQNATEPASDVPDTHKTTVADVVRSLTLGARPSKGQARHEEMPTDPDLPDSTRTRSLIAAAESPLTNPSSLTLAGSAIGATQSELGRTYFDRVARMDASGRGPRVCLSAGRASSRYQAVELAARRSG